MPLKLIKVKNSSNYYIRGTVARQYVYESTGTDRKEYAEAKRIKRENQLLEGAVHGKQRSATFLEAVQVYLEGGGSARHMGKVLEQFEFKPVRGIGQQDLDAAALRAYPDVAASTLNRHFYTPFIAVMNHAAQDGLCDFRKWRRPRQGRPAKRKWFSYEDAAKFYAHAPAHLQAIFVFCVYTGARITEAIELQVDDINLESRWAVLNASKTGGYRGVPLHSVLVDTACAKCAVLGVKTQETPVNKGVDGARKNVFLTPKGLPYTSHRDDEGKVQGGGYFKTAWNSTLKKAGLEGLTPYSMRHTFNNWLIMAGIDQATREALMGHDNGSTNAMYSDVPQAHLIAAIEKLKDFTDIPPVKSVNPDSFVQNSARTGKMRKGKKA